MKRNDRRAIGRCLTLGLAGHCGSRGVPRSSAGSGAAAPMRWRWAASLGAFFLAANWGSAAAAVAMLDMSSSSRLSSGLYSTTVPQFDAVSIGSLAAWDQAGRVAQTATPTLAGGQVYPGDAYEAAWSSFTQVIAGSTYRAYAILAGDYLDGGPFNYARDTVSVRNRVLVTDEGPISQSINDYEPPDLISIHHGVHGLMIADGVDNNVVVHAEELVSWSLTDCRSQGPSRAPTPCHEHGLGGYAGSATVERAGNGPSPNLPVLTISGDWAGRADLLYPDDPRGNGFELSAFLDTTVELYPGDSFVIDVTFDGLYEVYTGPSSGFRSRGLADFGGTSITDFVALDAKGMPNPAIRFTLLPLSEPLPEPQSLALVLLGIAGLAARRSRRTVSNACVSAANRRRRAGPS